MLSHLNKRIITTYRMVKITQIKIKEKLESANVPPFFSIGGHREALTPCLKERCFLIGGIIAEHRYFNIDVQ